MPDWTKSMKQTYEFYTVEPTTWTDDIKLDTVLSCDISRDSTADTLGSASISTDEMIGETYIRVYLVTFQNGITERHPLGTFLIQTPTYSFDGRMKQVKVDAYTPLIELKENQSDLGYTVVKDSNIMNTAKDIIEDKCRAPVLDVSCDKTLPNNFVAENNETWFSYISVLMSNANYTFGLDAYGRILFEKTDISLDAMQPTWIYDDGNESIIYADISLNNDLYGIPNVVEVIYMDNEGNYYFSRVQNTDEDSPLSINNRGRTIVKRVTDPKFYGVPTQEMVDEYAYNLLKTLSTLQYTVTYKHGYCPVNIGDCVLINYAKAGLNNVKAKVVSQNISCTPGCVVDETAVFNKKLWSGK